MGVMMEEEAMEVVIVEEEDMETMVVIITLVDIIQKEGKGVKVVLVTMVVDITKKEVKGVKVVLVTMVVDITQKEVKGVKVVLVTMVAEITQKEVKVGLVTIPREVSFNGNILPCVSDMATEYRVKSIFVVLALSVLILMFMQKMVQDLREISIASWGKLHETKTFRLNQMENSFIKEACWCLSYRGVSIL